MKKKIKILLIPGAASVLALLACLFTLGQPATFTTTITIYTGSSAHAHFNNLINSIKSREILEKTAIRLMARHLSLTEPDPEFCLPGTWQKLMSEVTAEIKKMVAISYSKPPEKPGANTVLPLATKEYYTIKAGDSPSKICQEFRLTLDELYLLNAPMPPFNGGQQLIVGSHPVPVREDSIIVTDEKMLRYEHLVKAMTDFKDADQDNYLVKTLHSSDPSYSIQKISEVKAKRIKNSDLLKLSFTSGDPAVCMQTLKILTAVFRSDYQNLMQSDIQIIDNPAYPIKPNASKRMILIIAAFLAGLLVTWAALTLLDFLNTGIKFPFRFAELSGLKLIGAFPGIPLKPDSRIDYPLIASRAVDQIAQRIRIENLRLNNHGEQPFLLFIISTREREGKTYLATRVVEKLRVSGSKVLFVKQLANISNAEDRRHFTSFDHSHQAWDFEYAIPENFISIRNINELLRNYTFITKGYHYVVIELPALLVQEYPTVLAQSGHLSILIGRATTIWKKADEEAVKLYQSSIDHSVMALLNDCRVDHLESIIGEIPKRRNLARS